jgi:seryl-tRNA synthetase
MDYLWGQNKNLQDQIKQLQEQHRQLHDSFGALQHRSRQREQDLEEEKMKLKKALEEQRANYADLRSAVQLHDVRQVKDLISEFVDLNMSIDNVCGRIADHIVDSQANQSSSLARGKLGMLAPEPLMNLKTTADVFVFTFLRFHISRNLYDALVKFHPKVPEKEKWIEECYLSVRKRGG